MLLAVLVTWVVLLLLVVLVACVVLLLRAVLVAWAVLLPVIPVPAASVPLAPFAQPPAALHAALPVASRLLQLTLAAHCSKEIGPKNHINPTAHSH